MYKYYFYCLYMTCHPMVTSCHLMVTPFIRYYWISTAYALYQLVTIQRIVTFIARHMTTPRSPIVTATLLFRKTGFCIDDLQKQAQIANSPSIEICTFLVYGARRPRRTMLLRFILLTNCGYVRKPLRV